MGSRGGLTAALQFQEGQDDGALLREQGVQANYAGRSPAGTGSTPARLDEYAIGAQHVLVHVQQRPQRRGDVAPGGFAEVRRDRVRGFGGQSSELELIANAEKLLRAFL